MLGTRTAAFCSKARISTGAPRGFPCVLTAITVPSALTKMATLLTKLLVTAAAAGMAKLWMDRRRSARESSQGQEEKVRFVLFLLLLAPYILSCTDNHFFVMCNRARRSFYTVEGNR